MDFIEEFLDSVLCLLLVDVVEHVLDVGGDGCEGVVVVEAPELGLPSEVPPFPEAYLDQRHVLPGPHSLIELSEQEPFCSFQLPNVDDNPLALAEHLHQPLPACQSQPAFGDFQQTAINSVPL